MARPREFNEDAARESALQVFWDKGYEATSLQDLLQAMGVSKSSFYDTFTSKHALFLDSMDRYVKTETRMAIQMLTGDTPGRDAIQAIFRYVIDKAYVEGDTRGCFMGNCAVERGGEDAAADKRIKDGFQSLEAAFADAIRRGQTNGDITTPQDPTVLGRFLVSNLNGIRMLAKTGPEREQVEDVVHVVLSSLD